MIQVQKRLCRDESLLRCRFFFFFFVSWFTKFSEKFGVIGFSNNGAEQFQEWTTASAANHWAGQCGAGHSDPGFPVGRCGCGSKICYKKFSGTSFFSLPAVSRHILTKLSLKQLQTPFRMKRKIPKHFFTASFGCSGVDSSKKMRHFLHSWKWPVWRSYFLMVSKRTMYVWTP